SLKSGQIARGRRIRAGRGFSGRVDGVNVEVLIAVVVFHVQDVLAVAAPEVCRYRTFGFRGQKAGRAERLVDTLDINIARVFPRLGKRNVIPIGRYLGTCDFGVSEKQVAVNDRWQTACFGFALRVE